MLHLGFFLLLVDVLSGQVVSAVEVKRVLTVRFAHETRHRHDQQERSECEQRNHQRGASLVRDRSGHLHELDDLIGETIDAFFEPQDREDNVGEVGDLLDVRNLTDGQVNLHASASTQGCAHSLQQKATEKRLTKRHTKAWVKVLPAECPCRTDAYPSLEVKFPRQQCAVSHRPCRSEGS